MLSLYLKENQEREEMRKIAMEEKKKEERAKQIEDLRQGRKPKFIKKCKLSYVYVIMLNIIKCYKEC